MKTTLLLIFIIAVLLRFIYFPDNVYFGYDQARDAYISQNILSGDIKIKGPPASFDSGIFHGALSYYIFTPFYLISSGDPTLVSIFLRLYNAASIFLVYLIASGLFNKKTGLMAAFLFAISYEQTQYSLFLSHPSLAVLSALLFYYGLLKLLFLKKQIGLVISAIGLGLSIQFHFSLIMLFIPLSILLLIMPDWTSLSLKRLQLIALLKNHYRSHLKHFFLAILALLVLTSTFIISELKYKDLQRMIFSLDHKSSFNLTNTWESGIFQLNRIINDNILVTDNYWIGLLITSIIFIVFFRYGKKFSRQMVFLVVWFAIGLIPYFINYSKIYYYGISGSVSLLIIVAFILNTILSKTRTLAFILILMITSSNIYLIILNNRHYFNQGIIVQVGLVLPVEKQVIDYVYAKSANEEFSINAVTIPYNVNTTWDYLFNWYGQKTYGYLPVWGGDAAPGYEGKLKIQTSRSELPKKRFLIVEPSQNIPSYMIEDLIKTENLFSRVIEEKRYGEIIIQYRQAI